MTLTNKLVALAPAAHATGTYDGVDSAFDWLRHSGQHRALPSLQRLPQQLAAHSQAVEGSTANLRLLEVPLRKAFGPPSSEPPRISWTSSAIKPDPPVRRGLPFGPSEGAPKPNRSTSPPLYLAMPPPVVTTTMNPPLLTTAQDDAEAHLGPYAPPKNADIRFHLALQRLTRLQCFMRACLSLRRRYCLDVRLRYLEMLQARWRLRRQLAQRRRWFASLSAKERHWQRHRCRPLIEMLTARYHVIGPDALMTPASGELNRFAVWLCPACMERANSIARYALPAIAVHEPTRENNPPKGTVAAPPSDTGVQVNDSDNDDESPPMAATAPAVAPPSSSTNGSRDDRVGLKRLQACLRSRWCWERTCAIRTVGQRVAFSRLPRRRRISASCFVVVFCGAFLHQWCRASSTALTGAPLRAEQASRRRMLGQRRSFGRRLAMAPLGCVDATDSNTDGEAEMRRRVFDSLAAECCPRCAALMEALAVQFTSKQKPPSLERFLTVVPPGDEHRECRAAISTVINTGRKARRREFRVAVLVVVAAMRMLLRASAKRRIALPRRRELWSRRHAACPSLVFFTVQLLGLHNSGGSSPVVDEHRPAGGDAELSSAALVTWAHTALSSSLGATPCCTPQALMQPLYCQYCDASRARVRGLSSVAVKACRCWHVFAALSTFVVAATFPSLRGARPALRVADGKNQMFFLRSAMFQKLLPTAASPSPMPNVGGDDLSPTGRASSASRLATMWLLFHPSPTTADQPLASPPPNLQAAFTYVLWAHQQSQEGGGLSNSPDRGPLLSISNFARETCAVPQQSAARMLAQAHAAVAMAFWYVLRIEAVVLRFCVRLITRVRGRKLIVALRQRQRTSPFNGEGGSGGPMCLGCVCIAASTTSRRPLTSLAKAKTFALQVCCKPQGPARRGASEQPLKCAQTFYRAILRPRVTRMAVGTLCRIAAAIGKWTLRRRVRQAALSSLAGYAASRRAASSQWFASVSTECPCPLRCAALLHWLHQAVTANTSANFSTASHLSTFAASASVDRGMLCRSCSEEAARRCTDVGNRNETAFKQVVGQAINESSAWQLGPTVRR